MTWPDAEKTHYMKWHHTASHRITWHVATHQINAPHVTLWRTTLLHFIPLPTSLHHNASHGQHGASPPGERSITQKTRFRLHWFVASRTFCLPILSLVDSVLFFSKFCPRLARATSLEIVSISCAKLNSKVVFFILSLKGFEYGNAFECMVSWLICKLRTFRMIHHENSAHKNTPCPEQSLLRVTCWVNVFDWTSVYFCFCVLVTSVFGSSSVLLNKLRRCCHSCLCRLFCALHFQVEVAECEPLSCSAAI